MKRFMLLTLVFCIIGTNFAFADKTISSNSTIRTNINYNENTKIGSNFSFNGTEIRIKGDLEIGSNADINGTIYVDGDLSVGGNATLNKDVFATGNIVFMSNVTTKGNVEGRNIDFGSNPDIQQKITATASIDLGSNASVENGLEVSGNVKAGSNLTLRGNSKIVGNFDFGSNSEIEGTLYVYGEVNRINGGSNANIEGYKTKITQGLTVGSNADVDTRLYLFGSEKQTGYNYSERLNNYSGIFGRIDPLLQYNLSESQISQVRNTVDRYLAEVQKNPSNKIETYTKMFESISRYIESESFDVNQFSNLQKEYLGKSFNSVKTSPTTSNSNTTNIVYTAFLPKSLEIKLDEVFANIPSNQHTTVIRQINTKIDELVEDLSGNKDSIQTVNILLGIRQYLNNKSTPSNQDILEQLGL